MATLFKSLLLISPILLQALAAPAQFYRRRVGGSGSTSDAPILLMTATKNANPLIIFYPSCVTD